jgi:predicted amidohydrolase YtcJ
VLASAAVGERADMIVTGDVYTVDAARSWAKAVAIRGDRIVAVGTEPDVRERVGSADVISGACVVPGFQDSHIHAAFAGRIRRHCNLDDLHTIPDYLDRIAAHAAAHPDDAWIVGGGWYTPLFGDHGPHRRQLDAAVPDRPVYLMNTDTHAAWVNTKALELAGITADTPDPWDGYFVRDAEGPTGCLQEGTAYTFWSDHVPADSTEDWMASVRVAQEFLHALGITAWQDAWVRPDLLAGYRALDDAGELTARVVTALWWDRHRGMEQIDELVEQRDWGTTGRIDAGTIKIMLDGCPESATGSMLAPYEGRFGEEHGRGIQFVEEDALREAVTRLDGLGFQIHQHALGDRAFRSALDAVEAARAANGWNDARHHIAHLQLPDPADIPRLRALGVAANIQPLWACPDPGIETLTRPRVGDRAERLYPIGDVVRSGAVLAMGSDWPISTPNVFEEMQVAVTRQVVGDGPDAPVLDPTQRITFAEALAGFTRGSAYVNHDDDAGTIAEGMRADLAILDRNPFVGSVYEIADTKVIATIAAGRVVAGG